MIKSLTGNNNIEVTGGFTSFPGHSGILRWNGTIQCMEVMNDYGWTQVSSTYASVDLSPNVKKLLSWVEQKIKEEQELEELAKQHESIRLVVQEIKDAKNRLKLLQHIAKDESTHNLA